MRDFASKPSRRESNEPRSGHSPEFGKNVKVDECRVLYLTIEPTDCTKLCFGASICLLILAVTSIKLQRDGVFYLTFVEDLLRNLIRKSFWWSRLLQDLILA